MTETAAATGDRGDLGLGFERARERRRGEGGARPALIHARQVGGGSGARRSRGHRHGGGMAAVLPLAPQDDGCFAITPPV